MKRKIIFLCFACIATVLTLVLILISCKNPGGSQVTASNQNKGEKQKMEETQTQTDSQGKTSGVISLLDSLGVGDVPSYPGADYDKELNDALGEFKNQLAIPDEYANVLYSVYTANDTSANVLEYYNVTLKDLGWEKSLDLTSGDGGFMVWEKDSNRDSVISYIVSTGKIQYGSRNEVVLLTGLIIPDYGKEGEDYTETTKEGSEIGPGRYLFF